MSKKILKKHHKISKNLDRAQSKKFDSAVEILGTTISGTHKTEVLKKIWLQRKEMLHIATVNPEFVMEARTNPRFRAALSHCLTIADGWGVVWATQILGIRVPERLSGSELATLIVAHAADHNEKVFLLGAAIGVAERAAANLRKIYPQLQISWYEGAQTVKLEQNEEASMTIAKINAYEPAYLMVAYGSPWQDIWIEDNRPYLRARVAIGVGGVLDEWAGAVKVCPAWLDQLGLKWLWRLVAQPWRLPRIMRVVQFGMIVLSMRLKRLF